MEKVTSDLKMKKQKDNGDKGLKRKEPEQNWEITGCISQNIFQKILIGILGRENGAKVQ